MIPVTADKRTMVIYKKDAPKIAIMIEEDHDDTEMDVMGSGPHHKQSVDGRQYQQNEQHPLRQAQLRCRQLKQCPAFYPLHKIDIRLGAGLLVPLNVCMWILYAPPMAILFVPLGCLQMAAVKNLSSTLMVPYLILTLLALLFYIGLGLIMLFSSSGIFALPAELVVTAEWVGCVVARELVFVIVVGYGLVCAVRCYQYVLSVNNCAKWAAPAEYNNTSTSASCRRAMENSRQTAETDTLQVVVNNNNNNNNNNNHRNHSRQHHPVERRDTEEGILVCSSHH